MISERIILPALNSHQVSGKEHRKQTELEIFIHQVFYRMKNLSLILSLLFLSLALLDTTVQAEDEPEDIDLEDSDDDGTPDDEDDDDDNDGINSLKSVLIEIKFNIQEFQMTKMMMMTATVC